MRPQAATHATHHPISPLTCPAPAGNASPSPCPSPCPLRQVNVLFFVNGYIFESVRRPASAESQGVNTTELFGGGRMLATDDLVDLFGYDEGDGGVGSTFLFRYSPWHARLLKSAGGGGDEATIASYPGGIPTGYYAGAYVILQALVALSTWIRLLYYFKGILRLGTLVHTMQRIVNDILPLLALVLVLFIAFWSSIWMLLNVELDSQYNTAWSEAWKVTARRGFYQTHGGLAIRGGGLILLAAAAAPLL